MAALRKTDVHAFAQCSQLFPSPSEYCCADSQILTHPATAFEEYSPPSPSYSLRRKKTSYLNQLISIRVLHGFFYKYVQVQLQVQLLYLSFSLVFLLKRWGGTRGGSCTDRVQTKGNQARGQNPASFFVPASRARNRVHINLTEAWIHSHVKSTFSAIHCKQFKTLPDGKRQACRHLSLQSLSGIFKEPLNLPD